ncbi:MAG TPA: hypothetical protein VGP25_21820 [Gemmatimonadaceae bacterium]|jgi:uncharacterized membrane protein|nr:hypothetical protein [Gemmatimonadaceae bacterium]
MTIADWLDSRRPPPPPALRARIDAALADSLGADEREAAEACLRAGEQVVESLLRENATSRDSAIDLLAADALVTYAFEAASDRPAELTALAANAMSRIGALGADGPPSSVA